MSSIESQLRSDLGPALADLITHTKQLGERLTAESEHPIWVWHAQNPFHARQLLVAHTQALDFADQQAANNTITCPSLVGVAPRTIALIEQVNDCRKSVTAILRKMDTKTIEVEDVVNRTTHYEKLVKVALSAYGRPRLHRKQIMRPFEILPQEPERVGFTWARIRKSERISTDEARLRIHNLLERANSPSRQSFLQQELEKVCQLSPDEPLTVVTPPHVHSRANIVWAATRDSKKVRRQTRRAVVPIFYPCKASQALPVLKPLADEPPPAGHRMKRRDVKIQDEPFLTSIRVHRYIAYAEA